MTDSNYFHELSILAENLIRLTENSSGEATQLCVTQGDKIYILGDLTEREGKYKLLMYESLIEIDELNPYKHLSGEYNSFKEIEEVIEATDGLVLIGDKMVGLFPAIDSNNYRSVCGLHCVQVGKIVYPLLGPDEEINPIKYEYIPWHCIRGRCAKRNLFI